MDPTATDWAWPWWTIVVALNVVQVFVGYRLFRRSQGYPDAADRYVRWMRWMGAVFVLVAMYRSVFVSRYLTQIAWFDTLANSSLLIRTFAVFAEMSFAGLIGFAMLRFNRDLPTDRPPRNPVSSFFLTKAPWVLIVSLALAQPFAYGGLITKSRLSFAIEETLWFIGFAAILPLAISQLRRARAVVPTRETSLLRQFAWLNAAWAVVYTLYGTVFHLPFEYWGTALEQVETGDPPLRTGWDAVVDSFLVVNQTHEWGDYGFGFLLWHTAYFTVCAWLALSHMRAPRLLAQVPETTEV